MNIGVERKEFLRALRIAAKVAGRGHILSKVKLTDIPTGVSIEATDCSMWFDRQVRGRVYEGGSVLVDLKSAIKVVRALTSKTVTIWSGDGNDVLIGDIRVESADPAEFPSRPEFPTTHLQYIDSYVLKQGLEWTAIAASRDVSRAALQCVHLRNGHLIASDGKRLAEYAIDLEGEWSLPLGAVAPIISVLDTSVMITVEHDAYTMMVRTPDSVFYTRQAEGIFPDYESLIPTKFDCEWHMHGPELRSAVQAVAAGQDKKQAQITIDTTCCPATMRHGAISVVVNGRAEGAGLQVTFKPSFLEDVLKVLKKRDATIGLQTGKGAAVLSVIGYRYAFMPIVQTNAK